MPYYETIKSAKVRRYFTPSGNPVGVNWILGQPGVSISDGKLILECSSKGDRELSAFSADVLVYGKLASIEWHYQTAKMIKQYDKYENLIVNEEGDPILKQVKVPVQGKGKEPEKIKIGDLVVSKDFSSQWYALLWIKYLDQNPNAVTYLKNFDEFTDAFKGNSLNCQADVIGEYVKDRETLMKRCEVLFNILKQQNRIEKQYKEEQDWWSMDSHR